MTALAIYIYLAVGLCISFKSYRLYNSKYPDLGHSWILEGIVVLVIMVMYPFYIIYTIYKMITT